MTGKTHADTYAQTFYIFAIEDINDSSFVSSQILNLATDSLVHVSS